MGLFVQCLYALSLHLVFAVTAVCVHVCMHACVRVYQKLACCCIALLLKVVAEYLLERLSFLKDFFG